MLRLSTGGSMPRTGQYIPKKVIANKVVLILKNGLRFEFVKVTKFNVNNSLGSTTLHIIGESLITEEGVLQKATSIVYERFHVKELKFSSIDWI